LLNALGVIFLLWAILFEKLLAYKILEIPELIVGALDISNYLLVDLISFG